MKRIESNKTIQNRLIYSAIFCCFSIFVIMVAQNSAASSSQAPRYQQVDASKVHFYDQSTVDGVYRVDEETEWITYFLKNGQDFVKVYIDEIESPIGPALKIYLYEYDVLISVPHYYPEGTVTPYFHVNYLSYGLDLQFPLTQAVNSGGEVWYPGNGFFRVNDHIVFLAGIIMLVHDDPSQSNGNSISFISQSTKNGNRPLTDLPLHVQTRLSSIVSELQSQGDLNPPTGGINTNYFTCDDPLACGRGEIYVPSRQTESASAQGGSPGGSETQYECQELPVCCCDQDELIEGSCYHPIVLVPGASGDKNAGAMGAVLEESKKYPCEANTFGISRDPSECWEDKGAQLADAIKKISEACHGSDVEVHALSAGGIVTGEAVDDLYDTGFDIDFHFWNTAFEGISTKSRYAWAGIQSFCMGVPYLFTSPEQDAIQWDGIPKSDPSLGSNHSGTCHVGMNDPVVYPGSQAAGPDGCNVQMHQGGHDMISAEYKHHQCCGDGDVQSDETASPPTYEQCDPAGSECKYYVTEDQDIFNYGTCNDECECEVPYMESYCGDEIADGRLGEECDPPGIFKNESGTISICNDNCDWTQLEYGACGDGVIQVNPENRGSEQCDPPGSACANNGTCSQECICVVIPPPPVCGNGIMEIGEDCEPPGSICSFYTDPDRTEEYKEEGICSDACTCIVYESQCGNGVKESGEECDPPGEFCGESESGSGTCNDSCKCVDNCGGDYCDEDGSGPDSGGYNEPMD